MCDPTTLMLSAGGVGALGQIQEGRAAAGVANYNARLAEMQAQDALARGSVEEGQYRNQIEQVRGEQRAAMGARNVAPSGTALDLLADTASIGEQDALTIRNNAAREALGLRSQAQSLRLQGKQLKRNARFGATGTLLTAGANTYGFRRLSE